MALILIFIGAVLIVSAIRNTQGQLATALEQDAPDYLKWALAIVAIGAIGYIPNAKKISNALLALVITVLVLKNYKNVIAGFQNVGSAQPTTAPAVSSSNSGSSSGGNSGLPIGGILQGLGSLFGGL